MSANQAIQFPDREEWDTAASAIICPALVNGMQITGAIITDVLLYRLGGETAEQGLAIFREFRVD
ncbi:hypothetical protein AZI84_24005, partial [Salmonella enterica subsp. enterica serovar Typhi]|uniref:DUF1488 family protein n=1 Tax=Salmonella enterica TaxID=28901 RepID=UPI0007801000